MRIVCPDCGAIVPREDVDPAHRRALCRICSELMFLGPDGAPLAGAAGGVSQVVPRPWDLQLRSTEDGPTQRFELALPPPPDLAYLAPLGIVCTAGSAVVAILSVWRLDSPGFAAIGAALSVGMAALTGLSLRRPCHFAFDGGHFSVRRRWRREVRERIDVIEGFRSTGLTRATSPSNSLSPASSVEMLTRDGRAVDLRLPLPSAEHARFLAQAFQDALETARARSAGAASLAAGGGSIERRTSHG